MNLNDNDIQAIECDVETLSDEQLISLIIAFESFVKRLNAELEKRAEQALIELGAKVDVLDGKKIVRGVKFKDGVE